MHAEVDKDRVRELMRELKKALGDEDVGEVQARRKPDRLADEEPVYTTVEASRLLGVSAAWMTAHVHEFPGAFRLSEGQRANYRFPKSSIEAYKRRQSVV